MLEVLVEDDVNASPDKVWEIAGDFGGVQKWAADVTSCTLSGSGVGAVRTILMQGIEVQERLESFDPAARTLSYSIVAGPLPLKNYLSTMKISDAGGKARVRWSSTFEAAGMSDEQAKQLVEMIYRQGIAGFRKALGC